VEGYGEDLAWVHDTAFGDFARRAAAGLLALLRRQGCGPPGVVVDLGCGSGIWAEELLRAGYDVYGADASAAMVELARRRAPQATIVLGSFLDVPLPACDAVTALGEVLNYAFDPRAGRGSTLARAFRRAHAALRPGGVLVFDLAEPGVEPAPRRTWQEHPDWALLLEAVEDRPRRRLERRITVFRRLGARAYKRAEPCSPREGAEGNLWRRSHEVHRLRLYERAEVLAGLERAGFRAKVLSGYGRMPMLPGRAGFLAVR
jgi:SAM-dependent methyltransferase